MESLIEYLKNIDPLLTALTVALTAILAGGAIFAAYIAWHHLGQIRNQNKLTTFLALLKELGEPEIRMNRNLIFQLHDKKSEDLNKYNQYIETIKNPKTIPLKYNAGTGKTPESAEYKYAVEETASCLDRLGFFLLEGGDPTFKKEAPIWVWTITSQMWGRTDWWVNYRKGQHPHYCKYFEDLAQEAKDRGFSGQLLNGGKPEKKEAF